MNEPVQYKEKLRAKKYFETLVDVNDDSIIRDLSLKLYDKQLNINKCSIRYAQAEVYYSFGDFETAIYKWCQVVDPQIIEWATLSIGDAYKESGLLYDAEKTYQLLQTENEYLKMVRLLKQLELYESTNNSHKIIEILRCLVDENVLFEDVYPRAKKYFRNLNLPRDQFLTTVAYGKKKFDIDLLNEMNLLLNECNNVKQQISYEDLLISLEIAFVEIDNKEFISFIQDVYEYGRKQSKLIWIDYFSEWLHKQPKKISYTIINMVEEKFFSDIEVIILENSYERLINSNFCNVLYTLFLVSEGTSLRDSTSALLIKWYEEFPKDKEKAFEPSKSINFDKVISLDFLNRANSLLSNIETRMKSLLFNAGDEYLKGLYFYLDSSKRRIMLCGTFSNGKTSFINALIGKALLSTDVLPTTSAVTLIKHGDGPSLKIINNKTFTGEVIEFDRQEDVLTFQHENKQSEYSNVLYEIIIDAPMLDKNNIVLIDTPGFNDHDIEKNPVFNSLHLTDHVLYVLSAENALTKKEKVTIDKIKASDWNGTVDFILNKIDYVPDHDELEELIEDIENKVIKHFGEGTRVIPFSSTEIEEEWLVDLENYFKSVQSWSVPQGRIIKSIWLFEQLLISIEKQHEIIISELNKKKCVLQKKISEIKDLVQKETSTFNGNLMKSYLDLEAELINSCQKEINTILKTFSSHITMNRDYDILKKELETKMNQVLEQYFNVKLKGKTKFFIKNSLMALDQELFSIKERIKVKLGNEMKDGHEVCFCSILLNDLTNIDNVAYTSVQILPMENDIQKLVNNLSRFFSNNSKREEERLTQLKTWTIENDYAHVTRHVVKTILDPLNLQDRLQEVLNKVLNIEKKKVVEEINNIEQELEKLENLLKALINKYEENNMDYFPRYRLLLSKWRYETGYLD